MGRTVSQKHDDSAIAFEYVIGTLEGSERKAFEQRLQNEEGLLTLIQQWEEDLSSLQDTSATRVPNSNVWNNIQSQLKPEKKVTKISWRERVKWSLYGALTCLGIVAIILKPWRSPLDAGIPIDYVAIMTTQQDQISLTTMANSASKILWLNWGEQNIKPNLDYQLWAKSRRDGITRSIGVFDNEKTEYLLLSEANWRLITDAESLMLTFEEQGGSPVDEPSTSIVAQGICVRMKPS
ncbi:anti-sigma factor [Colwellia sp. Bg11-28]|uniref:anti-sigma factor n=1 Tax=Colwellia sp. Bg11-28 TaxID=2058305 RepID=UPI000C32F435|nr:anti-sigma factor [Colwellia sp. Bg11-28]PKH89220.1 hypothetical protein CXF79_00025 [Colwellia sp. Bg11-28]